MGKVSYGFRAVCSYIKLCVNRLLGKKITFTFTDTIAYAVTLRTQKNGVITFGKMVQICNNAEIVANGGVIELKGNNYINRNSMIVSHSSIIIGEGTTIGPNVVIYDHDHDGKGTGFTCEPIVLGKNVWIGAGSIILKGVTIGDGAVIGAGTLVAKNIESNRTVINKRNTVVL